MEAVSREEIKRNGYPTPTPVSEKLMGSLSWKQGQILTSLADLAEKEQALISEINSLAPTPSGVLRVGVGITICEDEDDWRVITMGQRGELRKVKDRIKVALSTALDEGMGCLGLVQRQCSNYEVIP